MLSMQTRKKLSPWQKRKNPALIRSSSMPALPEAAPTHRRTPDRHLVCTSMAASEQERFPRSARRAPAATLSSKPELVQHQPVDDVSVTGLRDRVLFGCSLIIRGRPACVRLTAFPCAVPFAAVIIRKAGLPIGEAPASHAGQRGGKGRSVVPVARSACIKRLAE